jgi:ElaB/YqjD/DUF883 family membrane-anchored ribosome-binding protein
MTHNESKALMQHELLAQLNSILQLIVDDLEKEMEEIRMNYSSSLESEHEQVVKEVEEVTNKL